MNEYYIHFTNKDTFSIRAWSFIPTADGRILQFFNSKGDTVALVSTYNLLLIRVDKK